jgi:hypothetical protein
MVLRGLEASAHRGRGNPTHGTSSRNQSAGRLTLSALEKSEARSNGFLALSNGGRLSERQSESKNGQASSSGDKLQSRTPGLE